MRRHATHALILTSPPTAARSALPSPAYSWPAPREKWAPASINILAGEVLKTPRGVKIKPRSEGETATRANSTGVRKWVSMHKGRLSYLRHPSVVRREKKKLQKQASADKKLVLEARYTVPSSSFNYRCQVHRDHLVLVNSSPFVAVHSSIAWQCHVHCWDISTVFPKCINFPCGKSC